jgi:hypothetical protein
MNLFVTISCGERAIHARPIVAISDQVLVGEMLAPLAKLLTGSATVQQAAESGRLLRLLAREGQDGEEVAR